MRDLPLLAVLGIVLTSCGNDSNGGEAPVELTVETTVEFERTAEPVALAATASGDVLVGERRTGVIRSVSVRGDLGAPVARLEVMADEADQRGLLGLAARGDEVYAAWTRADDGHIVVAEVGEGSERLVWIGPPSSDRANGGHLDFLPDGRLLVGIGDLQEPDRVQNPETPHGKILAIDPAGPADQRPTPLSSGWNNPFAFVVTRDGEVWVADNAPGNEPERLGRGDRDTGRIDLPGKRAPAALVELGPDLLGLCGYLDGHMAIVDLRHDEPEVSDPAAEACRTGAAALPNDRVAVSDGERVHILVAR